MSLLNYFGLIVFLHCSTAIFGHETSTNNVTACKTIHFDGSKVEDLLRLMLKPTTKTIEITATVASANKTRVFPEMKWPWANEIGRTLISLVARAKSSVFDSPLFTFPFEVGIKGISIVAAEDPVGCLPSGKNGSDQVFNHLLKELFSHIQYKDNNKYYQLCRPLNEAPYRFNCCQITGGRKLTLCADYSSIVLEWARPGSIAAVAVFCILTLPFVLEHIITYEEMTFYKSSFSHMSLISFFSMIFCEGRGWGKTFFRRLAFVGLSFTVFYFANYFNYAYFLWLFIVWAVCFCFCHFFRICFEKNFPMENFKIKEKFELKFKENLISCFKIPISLPFVNEHCQRGSSWEDIWADLKIYSLKIVLLVLSLVLVLLCLVKFVLFDFILRFVFPFTCRCRCTCSKCGKGNGKLLVNIFAVPIRLLTLTVIIFLSGSILFFGITMTVGLILNGEFFNPFFAPVVTLIAFVWKNWQLLVEAPCLQLKTLIIRVCKKKAEKINFGIANNETTAGTSPPNQPKTTADNQTETSSNNVTSHKIENSLDEIHSISDRGSDVPGGSSSRGSPGDEIDAAEKKYREKKNREKKYRAIKFDERTGEAMISKKLYKEVSELDQILPLGDLLFHFFRRVLFVCIYAWAMLIVLILGEESGISGSIRAISSIVAFLLPFIFNTIYADNVATQKDSTNMATTEKLEHILKIKKRENDMIFVELVCSTERENEDIV
ncbi:uncharacterized protein LOC114524065 isoform X2 [Dendronephthya gigantea]|uniref:uncharacterized protein LOC114524065 isoform X2 n=1 Tax=Dendronephthya gigantea TaxID=151771 RepID=UPI00106C6470|nr:uncharacterized protein LOC114524065 isoform X2 [Dendronephthya gigantea]